jgi:hypothetical protein
MKDSPIDLDHNKLLGLCQIARVAGQTAGSDQFKRPARLLSKVGHGDGEMSPNGAAASRLLSKVGPGEVPDGAARLLSKVGHGEVPPGGAARLLSKVSEFPTTVPARLLSKIGNEVDET